MNATAQKAHRTVTKLLDERLAVVESLTEQLMWNDGALAQNIGDEQRAYVDNDVRLLRQQIQGLQIDTVVLTQGTFWQRVRWLLVGR